MMRCIIFWKGPSIDHKDAWFCIHVGIKKKGIKLESICDKTCLFFLYM